MSTRLLIVNADDFGRSPGVNSGVIKAHKHGILTSASLMVRWPAAEEAAAYGRASPELSTGLHADLGEWTFQADEWVPVYEVVPANDAQAAEHELQRQVVAFRELMQREPTHLDSHQHVHGHEPWGAVFRRIAEALDIPLRGSDEHIRYSGEFYGHTVTGGPLPSEISVERLIEILTALEPGITELGCHPGEESDAGSVYGDERQAELAVLCDPAVRATIEREGILLRSFADVSTRSRGPAC